MKIHSLIPRAFNREMKPFTGSPFDLLHQEINDLFDKTLSSFPAAKIGNFAPFSPKIDVSETEKEIRVTADLPGINEEDVKIELNNNVLTIEGTKQSESEEKEKVYHIIERTYGSFKRSIAIPYDVDIEKVDATFTNGVLNITIPKPEVPEQTVKQIKIKKNES